MNPTSWLVLQAVLLLVRFFLSITDRSLAESFFFVFVSFFSIRKFVQLSFFIALDLLALPTFLSLLLFLPLYVIANQFHL